MLEASLKPAYKGALLLTGPKARPWGLGIPRHAFHASVWPCGLNWGAPPSRRIKREGVVLRDVGERAPTLTRPER